MNKIKNNQPKLVDENSQNCVSRSSLFKKIYQQFGKGLQKQVFGLLFQLPKAGRLVNNLGDE